MLGRSLSCASALLFLLATSPHFSAAQPKPAPAPNKDKNIWNYDGGLVMMTDGAIPNGPCFRLTGKLTAPNFFDNLKREDTETGPLIHRGHDVVTHFPDRMSLIFEVYDTMCPDQLAQPISSLPPRVYLNKNIVEGLRVGFYWKHGLELRPAPGVQIKSATATPILPYDTEAVKTFPKKYEWWFEVDVPSAGIPVTDSLVLVLITPDNHIAARVAARM